MREVLGCVVELHHGTQEIAHRFCRFGFHGPWLPGCHRMILQSGEIEGFAQKPSIGMGVGAHATQALRRRFPD